jgi:hypothetical protein
MPRPLTPLANDTPDAAMVAPILADMDRRDVFADALDYARWTLELLRLRTAAKLSRSQACLAQRHIVATLPVTNRSNHWSLLAVTDVLGRINTASLTHDCLRELIRHTANLWDGVFGHLWTDETALRTAVNSRKVQLAATCPGAGSTYAVFLDRAADALRPYLA